MNVNLFGKNWRPHGPAVLQQLARRNGVPRCNRGPTRPARPQTCTATKWQVSSDARVHQLCLDEAGGHVTFDSDLWSTTDKTRLQVSVASWEKRKSELLPEYSEAIYDVNQLAPQEVAVKWRASWVPRQLLWLVNLGRAWPGLRVEFYMVLDRYDQVTQFTWRALFRLVSSAVRTGVLRVPASAIEGVCNVKTNSAGEVVSISERVWLVPLFEGLKVKNRRVARDMLLWQEVRQPAGIEYGKWDELVMDRLQISSVPGMGQFDVDGLDSSDRQNVYADVLAIMAFMFVILVAFGVSYATVYFQTHVDLPADLLELYG